MSISDTPERLQQQQQQQQLQLLQQQQEQQQLQQVPSLPGNSLPPLTTAQRQGGHWQFVPEAQPALQQTPRTPLLPAGAGADNATHQPSVQVPNLSQVEPPRPSMISGTSETMTLAPPTMPPTLGSSTPREVREDPFAVPEAAVVYWKPLNPNRVMGVAFLAALVMVSLPLFAGLVLLQDPTFKFWMGPGYPLQLIWLGSTSLLLLALMLLTLALGAQRQALTVRLLCSLAASFSSLLGVLLVLSSVQAGGKLDKLADGIDASSCRSSQTDVVQLMDYSVVLYNLRMTPACFALENVERCHGWAENKYTRYLRLLEEEFDCGPLCPEEPAPQLRPASVAGTDLLQAGGAELKKSGKGRQLAPDAEPLYAAGLHPGDFVRLDSNETLVREIFKALPGFSWHSEMASMLGKQFRVLQSTRKGVVGLPSPDGSQDGVWYFPVDVLELVSQVAQVSPPPIVHAASLKLFSHGSTSMTCLPIISTRLRVISLSFAKQFTYHGLLLLVIGLTCGVLGLLRGFDRPGGSGFPTKV